MSTLADGVRIASITLTGNNADVIAGALRSVIDWVDICLVVDTGVTDRSLEIAEEVAGDRLVVRTFPWIEDFAAARNFSLHAAAQSGADWALILDTDERIVSSLRDIRATVAAQNANVLRLPYVGGSFSKLLGFRLPAAGRYIGPIHEYFHLEHGSINDLPDTFFATASKADEDATAKYTGYLDGLQRYSAEHPDDPRWHYYLGDTLQILGRYEEAVASFEQCADLKGWGEEGAWACYRAAECLMILVRFDEALRFCGRGLVIHSGIAELAWLAAFGSWKLEQYANAITWAWMSVSLGRYEGHGNSIPRHGFTHPPALYEGPYDVLRFALAALDRQSEAAEAEMHFQAAKEMRTRAQSLRY